jgi:hypothetical protein
MPPKPKSPRKPRIKKGHDPTLPPPMFFDGGNKYHGKSKENSQLLCMLCKVYGCGCVRPAVTPADLVDALEKRISSGETAIKFGFTHASPELVATLRARLARVKQSIANGVTSPVKPILFAPTEVI